jgi:hypothetical protein
MLVGDDTLGKGAIAQVGYRTRCGKLPQQTPIVAEFLK